MQWSPVHDGALSATVEERILIYLSDYKTEERYEYPPTLTQRAIADGAGIQQKHLSRHLKELMGQGLIEERAAKVEGMKQRMKVYVPTPQGFERARELRENFGKKVVTIELDGKRIEMMISQIDKATSRHLKLSDIVRHALESHILDLKALEEVEESRRRQEDEKERKVELYKEALETAWRSGILTPSERVLINALSEHIGMTAEECTRIEEEFMKGADFVSPDKRELYDELRAIAYSMGEPPKVAKEMLAALRKRMGIPEDTVC